MDERDICKLKRINILHRRSDDLFDRILKAIVEMDKELKETKGFSFYNLPFPTVNQERLPEYGEIAMYTAILTVKSKRKNLRRLVTLKKIEEYVFRKYKEIPPPIKENKKLIYTEKIGSEQQIIIKDKEEDIFYKFTPIERVIVKLA